MNGCVISKTMLGCVIWRPYSWICDLDTIPVTRVCDLETILMDMWSGDHTRVCDLETKLMDMWSGDHTKVCDLKSIPEYVMWRPHLWMCDLDTIPECEIWRQYSWIVILHLYREPDSYTLPASSKHLILYTWHYLANTKWMRIIILLSVLFFHMMYQCT